MNTWKKFTTFEKICLILIALESIILIYLQHMIRSFFSGFGAELPALTLLFSKLWFIPMLVILMIGIPFFYRISFFGLRLKKRIFMIVSVISGFAFTALCSLSLYLPMFSMAGCVGGFYSMEPPYRHVESFPVTQFVTEEYDRIYESGFKHVIQYPLSTFSIDVDTASYSNVRRYIENGEMPPKDAVRIEEMINYFNYEYPLPDDGHPFSVSTEISECPWNNTNKLVHIGLRGTPLDYDDLKPSNLVFLIDSSGSMSDRNKLPLLKRSFQLLLNQLSREDKIAIVAYAGSAGLVLPSTPASNKDLVLSALDKLKAGGSTAGGAGIQLAYEIALKNFIDGGNNRVILATDGDFNVGLSSTSDLVRLIEEKRAKGIYLTICGFGMGNYKDGRMEQISNAGNGVYFYIDNIREAEKVFVREMRANMFTIASDVKIQIEFNPSKIKAYRLIGYENRTMAGEDFNDDKKDAGELGPDHTVTALYEIVLPDSLQDIAEAPELKYQDTVINPESSQTTEMMTIKLRYKSPGQEISKLIEKTVSDKIIAFKNTSDNFRFSAAVAGCGMLLRNSKYTGDLTYKNVIKLAKDSIGSDKYGYREEFIILVNGCLSLNK